MRTTVTLDEEVEQLLREDMHRYRRSFKESLNLALRIGLKAGAEAEREPFEIRAQSMRLRPGIDERRLNQLADELEAEGLAKRMRQAEALAMQRPRRP